MAESEIKLREFNSADDFLNWWKSPAVEELRRKSPEEFTSLESHIWVKPWLPAVKGQTKEDDTSQTIGIGKPFGRYLLQRELGRGGMGIVYLAHDTSLDRKVALKIMLVKSPEAVERFVREARSVAKLTHPNIIQIHEVGRNGEALYFTMEYITGVSLESLIKDKQLTLLQVAAIIRDVAGALNYAHNQQIIHRDVKPSNILIDSSGHPYITDFGLAKELSDLKTSMTLTGAIIGTPDYMSPEQARGDKKKVKSHSDIFSLGATLYYCLTTWPPFRADELYEVLEGVIYKDPIPPTRINKTIPRDLEAICLKALEKEPAHRYQTTQQLAEDIQRYLNDEPVLAHPISTPTRFLRKVWRHKTEFITIIAASLTLLAAGLLMITSSTHTKQQVEGYRLDAYEAFQESDFDKARDICNKILALSPNEPDIQEIMKKSEGIIKEREQKLIQENDRTKKAREIRNKAQSILDRIKLVDTPQDKIGIGKESLQVDPNFGEAYQAMGYAYMDLKDFNTAFDYFTKAIEKNPGLAYSYFQRAYITSHIRNKPDEAGADLNKALELDPNNHTAYLAKGMREIRQKNYDKALEYINKAIELKPDYAMAYNNRGNCYYEKGMVNQAMEDYNKAIELKADYAGAYHNRGDVYCLKGEFNRAMADYTKSIDLTPDEPEVYYDRAKLYARQGKLTQAIADGEAFLKRAPLDSQANEVRQAVEGWKKQLGGK